MGSQRTGQRWEVKRTNADLPNTCRRSITETIIDPIGQNILLTYPHFGIDFLQPPRFLNSEDSETVNLDHFLFSLRNIIQTSNREMYFVTGRSVSISQQLLAAFHFYL